MSRFGFVGGYDVEYGDDCGEGDEDDDYEQTTPHAPQEGPLRQDEPLGGVVRIVEFWEEWGDERN